MIDVPKDNAFAANTVLMWQTRALKAEAQLEAVQGAIPWEWLEMANIKYGSEIFPCPYEAALNGVDDGD
jgi:hypothetical protein